VQNRLFNLSYSPTHVVDSAAGIVILKNNCMTVFSLQRISIFAYFILINFSTQDSKLVTPNAIKSILKYFQSKTFFSFFYQVDNGR
jgi:hypothetical protein